MTPLSFFCGHATSTLQFQRKSLSLLCVFRNRSFNGLRGDVNRPSLADTRWMPTGHLVYRGAR